MWNKLLSIISRLQLHGHHWHKIYKPIGETFRTLHCFAEPTQIYWWKCCWCSKEDWSLYPYEDPGGHSNYDYGVFGKHSR
jgi:hypothetical protein